MKRYLAEMSGTFFLTFALTLAVNPLMGVDALAAGAMFMAMLYLTMPISGGHLNPAVSLAHWMRGGFAVMDLPGYMIAQVLGACLVSVFTYFAFGKVAPVHQLPEANVWSIACMELLLTFVLCAVVLMLTTTRRYESSVINGLVIGLTLSSLVAFHGVYNPAVACGSMIANFAVNQAMPTASQVLVYVLMPLLGGVLAAWKFKFYRLQSA